MGSLVSLPWPGVALVSMAGVSLGLLWRQQRMALPLGLCLVALLLGQARYQAALPSTGSSELAFYNGRGPLELQGWVAAEPDVRDRTANLRLEVSGARVDGLWQPVNGTAVLVVPRYPGRAYGDQLRAAGRLEAPASLDRFDYPAYLARQGVYSIMPFPKIEVLPGAAGLAPWGWLLDLKERLARNLSRALPEPQASLARGILLGLRASIPDGLMDSFNRSGTTHIIVISGHNLSLLAGYLLRAGAPLVGRRRALWLSLAAISLYTLLVGAQPPVLRAAIMGGLFILGAYLGRQRESVVALALAAAAMASFQPLMLWDVSFQLSFAATAGLIFLSPVLLKGLQHLWPSPGGNRQAAGARAHRYLVESLSVTLAATIAVLPLLLINFQRLSLIAPMANLLVLPALPGIMLGGALTAGLGFLEPLGQFAGWVAWPFLTYMVAVVQVLAGMPAASLEVSDFQPGLAMAYYALVGLAHIWKPRLAAAG